MSQTGSPSPANVQNFAGSTNNTYAGSRALLLKTYGGEVLKHFDEKFSLKDKIRTRTISGGKTAQFPAIGQASAEHFVPGQEIVGQSMVSAEKTISINDYIVSSVFIHNIDEMLTHFEFRSEYSKQMAQAIALTVERSLFQMAVRDARQGDVYVAAQLPGVGTIANNASGQGAGVAGMENAISKRLNGADTADIPSKLTDEAFHAAAYFDENDIPTEGRNLFVSPRTYYSLINQTDKTIINSDFSAGNGNFGEAVIYKVAGFNIIPTNHLAIDGTNAAGVGTNGRSGGADDNFGPDGRTPLGTPTNGFSSDYAIDARGTLGMFMHTEGMGMAKLQDLTTESEYSVAKQGNLLVAKLLCGISTLRPDCLYEVNNLADNAAF